MPKVELLQQLIYFLLLKNEKQVPEIIFYIFFRKNYED